MKTCKDCNITKPLDEFPISGKNKTTGKIWYRGRCKKCQNLKFNVPTGKISSTRFKKGQVAWNKNTKGLTQANKTSFKKGTTIGKKTWFKKGDKPWFADTGLPVEIRDKISITRRKNGKCRDCSNYYQWRKDVFERDGNKCKECSSTNRLHAHHIKCWNKFTELRFEIDNGITLCPSCHSKLHGKKTGFKSGKVSWNKGKQMTKEAKKKMKKSLKKYYAKKRLEKINLKG